MQVQIGIFIFERQFLAVKSDVNKYTISLILISMILASKYKAIMLVNLGKKNVRVNNNIVSTTNLTGC